MLILQEHIWQVYSLFKQNISHGIPSNYKITLTDNINWSEGSGFDGVTSKLIIQYNTCKFVVNLKKESNIYLQNINNLKKNSIEYAYFEIENPYSPKREQFTNPLRIVLYKDITIFDFIKNRFIKNKSQIGIVNEILSILNIAISSIIYKLEDKCFQANDKLSEALIENDK